MLMRIMMARMLVHKIAFILCKTDIFFPGASGRDSAGKFGHQSSSSNWGRGGSTQHPFVPGETFLVLSYLLVLMVKTVSCLRRIILSVILNILN